MDVRYWKQLKRHPLSAEYDDIKGEAWERFVAGVKQFGIVRNRPVTIYEGKVVDGWQLQRACVECDVKPPYVELKLQKGMSVDQWIETVNDLRRDTEAQSLKEKRAAARRERVANARENGQSLRTIAENEDVSLATVRSDLAKSPPDCAPRTVEGQDGKSHPATKPNPRRDAIKDFFGDKQREPGDDTEEIEREEKANKQARKSQGKVLFDWREFDKHFGPVARGPDSVAKAFSDKGTEYKECLAHLASFRKVWESWRKRLAK